MEGSCLAHDVIGTESYNRSDLNTATGFEMVRKRVPSIVEDDNGI